MNLKIKVSKEIKTYKKGSDVNTWVKITITNEDTEKYEDLVIMDVIPKEILVNVNGIKNASVGYSAILEDPVIAFEIDELGKDASKTFEYMFKKNLSTISASDVNKWKASFAFAGEEVIDLCKGVTCTVKVCQTATCDSKTGKCNYANKTDGASCGTNKECKKGKCVAKVQDVKVPKDENIAEDLNIANGSELPQLPLTEIAIAIVLLILAVAGFWFVKNKFGNGENSEQETEQPNEGFNP